MKNIFLKNIFLGKFPEVFPSIPQTLNMVFILYILVKFDQIFGRTFSKKVRVNCMAKKRRAARRRR
jgi:hypothetical protein